MLTTLNLKDFVIVDQLALDLSTGFTVLTGETGAGKSILIDAIQLIRGARADADMVRKGAERANIIAEFMPWKRLFGGLKSMICRIPARQQCLYAAASIKTDAHVPGSMALR